MNREPLQERSPAARPRVQNVTTEMPAQKSSAPHPSLAPSATSTRAAENPSEATGAHPRRASVWKIWLPIVIAFVLADVTFNHWFWKIPKLSGEADWGYQFQIDLQRLSEREATDAVRVLAFGSSVSGSFDAHQVQSLLETSQSMPPVQVHRLLKPGIKPADYRLLFEADGASLHPDVAVLTFNLLDFLNPSFERSFRPTVREALPPFAVLREQYDSIPTVADKLDLALASVSNLYRYRKEIRSALTSHVAEAVRWLRAKPVHAAYGLYDDGYTQQRFGIPVEAGAPVRLEYYVDPEWIRQRGKVDLTFSMTGTVLARRVETEPGWKSVRLDKPSSGRILEVRADSVWTPRAGGASDDVRLLGVRLRTLPPRAAMDGTRPPYHYPPHVEGEIEPFLRMGSGTGAEFAKKWNEVLNSQSEFGTRFRAYRDAKLRTSQGTFSPTGEYAELERLVRDLSARGTFVALVNTPESPWLLARYRETPYYQAYLAFFRGLAATYPNVQFYDLSNALPPEDFNDWHHVNYIGSIKLGRVYADIVRVAVGNLKRKQGA
jgi:hypothetical protein